MKQIISELVLLERNIYVCVARVSQLHKSCVQGGAVGAWGKASRRAPKISGKSLEQFKNVQYQIVAGAAQHWVVGHAG